MGFCKATLIGNLTRDPELKYTPQGTAICKFCVACGSKYKNKAGEMVEDVTYLNIIVWGKQGENASKYLSKGRPVFIEGRISIREYEAQDGQKKKITEVVAETVLFLGGGKDERRPQPSKADPQTQPEKGTGQPDLSTPPDGGFDDVPF